MVVMDHTGPPSSIIIERVAPELDGGRHPVKREVGDVLHVSADIFKESHDKIAAFVRFRRWTDEEWSESEMTYLDNDRWGGQIALAENTRYIYTIIAFPDIFQTWRDELKTKIDAGLDVTIELMEGRKMIVDAAGRAAGDDLEILRTSISAIDTSSSPKVAATHALSERLLAVIKPYRNRSGMATYHSDLVVVVDRVVARFAAWYEFFLRSAGTDPRRGATLKEAESRLPAIAAMGFDVAYLLPIHPIGHTHRKGPNNSLVAGLDDPGVPYAIGNDTGGHDAIDPALGTMDDFRHFVAAAHANGLEVALDLAINCSPDHPWVKAHPDWFFIRADGSIKYSENPPKKYEDIYPINFATADWKALWSELKRIVIFWIGQGVTTFRVDNPHTKPTVFWEWLVSEVQKIHPEVIFLSEAFTRPKVMKALAKAGFTQSYTYFTWRNFKQELIEYFTELTQSDVAEYMRGNLFPNTHDILPYILQEGGRPAFKLRAALATTLSSVYGIYSGFELCEATAVPGKEEYANSEKYQFKVWDWDRPGNIVDYLTQLNTFRRSHPALQEYNNLRFFNTSDENVLGYLKSTPDHSDIVVVLVNLDPFQSHATEFHLPLGDLSIAEDDTIKVTDLLDHSTFLWSGTAQHISLDPHHEPARFFSLQRWAHIDYAEPCY